MEAPRSFALKLIPLFVVSSWLLHRHHPTLTWPWAGLGLVLVAMGLIKPQLLNPLHHLFSALGQFLRSAMSRVILESVYVLVLTPVAWVARRFGKKFLDLETNPSRDTYFVRRSKENSQPEDYEKAY